MSGLVTHVVGEVKEYTSKMRLNVKSILDRAKLLQIIQRLNLIIKELKKIIHFQPNWQIWDSSQFKYTGSSLYIRANFWMFF